LSEPEITFSMIRRNVPFVTKEEENFIPGKLFSITGIFSQQRIKRLGSMASRQSDREDSSSFQSSIRHSGKSICRCAGQCFGIPVNFDLLHGHTPLICGGITGLRGSAL
jgi:hypothetical protein